MTMPPQNDHQHHLIIDTFVELIAGVRVARAVRQIQMLSFNEHNADVVVVPRI